MIRVLVVHEERLLRSALEALLTSDCSLEVSSASWDAAWRGGDAADGDGDGGGDGNVDVCVADADCLGAAALPGARTGAGRGAGTGAAAAAGVADRSGTRRTAGALVVLAAPQRPGTLRRAFDAGAVGYVDKQGSPRRLLQAVHQVAQGERFIDESLAFGFLQAAQMPLTPRELAVLTQAAHGASIAEIAVSLHLSRGTVRNYMAAATRKVGARNRVDAIRISQSAGWM
ncbi:DNA-binding response regulator [Streptomyces sp. PR69]|uniref:DNA-binding response regulator n=1 Tax=Streptomyces sp. PR69 TaxID=2984950 RepID=UPI002B2691E9|nr:DNA-binding response regulator [Streptomyces sp. PR69]